MKNIEIKDKKNKKDYFRYYADNYLRLCKIKNKESTYSCYYYIINSRILPYFNNLKVKKITNTTILNYIDNLTKQKLSNKTIKDTLSILYSILKNTNNNVNIVYPKVIKKDIKILNKNDQLRLEEYLINNIDNITFGIYLSLYTGLRIGELCALRFSDIDLLNNKIIIKNTVVRVKNESKYNKTILILNSAKSNSSIREIPLTYNLKNLFNKINKNNDSFYLLSNNEKFIDPRNFYNKYKTILKELNISNYNFHTLRHTFASRCIEYGADPKTLSLILGHSSVKITLDRYVHPNFNNKVKLMNNLELVYKF